MEKNVHETLIFWLIIAFFALISFLKARKVTKQMFAKQYNISKPTLAGWIENFQQEINIKDWKAKRFLTFFEERRLIAVFGDDSKMVLNKKQIAAIAESDYKTVAANVKKNLSKIGITLEAWESCSVFPPNISKRILDMLEGNLT